MLCLFSVILFFSCNKDAVDCVPLREGVAYFNFNGIADSTYIPSILNSVDKETFYLSIIYYTKSKAIKRIATVSKIKYILGKQRIVPIYYNDADETYSSFATAISGDIAGNFYYINDNDTIEDYIQLTKIDEVSGEVEGNFQMSYYVDTIAIFDLSTPNTVILRDGYFKAYLP